LTGGELFGRVPFVDLSKVEVMERCWRVLQFERVSVVVRRDSVEREKRRTHLAVLAHDRPPLLTPLRIVAPPVSLPRLGIFALHDSIGR
jgi:hypothetical protein